MSAFWDDVDDKQMTHSDEPTTAEEREGMLKMVNATPPANQLEARYGLWIGRLITEVTAGERHLQSLKDDAGDMLCDLEDQVERLEESARFMRDDYSPVGARGCRLCVYEDGVLRRSCRLHQEIARLETERGCPSCAHCQLKRGGHLA